jgi:hypothetical protein
MAAARGLDRAAMMATAEKADVAAFAQPLQGSGPSTPAAWPQCFSAWLGLDATTALCTCSARQQSLASFHEVHAAKHAAGVA